jgi:hypothetical protein
VFYEINAGLVAAHARCNSKKQQGLHRIVIGLCIKMSLEPTSSSATLRKCRARRLAARTEKGGGN